MLKHLCTITLAFIVAAMTAGCDSKPKHPQEMIMADSAFMQGNYDLGNALLETMRKQSATRNDEDKTYLQLLTMEQAYVKSKLSYSDFPIADSLCNYYENSSESRNYAKALLFTGHIFYSREDYPKAIEYYLKAKDLAKENRDNHLLCLICRSIGDLYFDQRRLEDCIPYYQDYYRLAAACHDSLRMAYGASKMSYVATIKNDIDSTIYYCKEAIRLASTLKQRDAILPFVKAHLCDIYIQTEQFDKALELMPRDSMNTANWAYWHYGQEHVDSAVYYFRQTLGRYKWQGEVEILRLLAQMERERGNREASLDYYEQLADASDSLRVQQQQEATERIAAQFDYSRIKEQRDRLEHQSRERAYVIVVLGIVLLAVVAVGIYAFFWYRAKRRAVLSAQKLLQNELDEQKEQSQQQKEENERELNALRQQLQEAQMQQNTTEQEHLASQVDVLESENQRIEARQHQRQLLLQELHDSALYGRLKSTAPTADKKMGAGDWEELRRHLDAIYDGFTARLLRLAKLSETELHICYLLKIDMPPAEIAAILYKSKAAITMARRRMLYKLSAKRGRAEELDDIIHRL